MYANCVFLICVWVCVSACLRVSHSRNPQKILSCCSISPRLYRFRLHLIRSSHCTPQKYLIVSDQANIFPSLTQLWILPFAITRLNLYRSPDFCYFIGFRVLCFRVLSCPLFVWECACVFFWLLRITCTFIDSFSFFSEMSVFLFPSPPPSHLSFWAFWLRLSDECIIVIGVALFLMTTCLTADCPHLPSHLIWLWVFSDCCFPSLLLVCICPRVCFLLLSVM